MSPDPRYPMLSHYQFELHTKLQNFKKNVFMIYAYVIHTCLDVALMEEDLHLSVISKKHLPTSTAYNQPLVEATILTCAKTYYPQFSQKNAKTSLLVYWMCPHGQDPLVASVSVCFGGLCLLWHQFWSALTASEWRLTEQTADRVDKRSQNQRINQIFPHHHTVFLMKM